MNKNLENIKNPAVLALIDSFFQPTYDQELAKNPWLENYLYGTVSTPGGEPGTVLSGSYRTKDGRERVIPTIIPNFTKSKVSLSLIPEMKDAIDINKKYGYGIDFDNSDTATLFSMWLSKKHKDLLKGK